MYLELLETDHSPCTHVLQCLYYFPQTDGDTFLLLERMQ